MSTEILRHASNKIHESVLFRPLGIERKIEEHFAFPPPRYGNVLTDGLLTETVIGNSGIVGGGSSATGDRPTDEDARSGGEMADARPPGRAEATPGAVRLQGGTSMSALPIQRHEPIQRHDSRPLNDEDPPYWDYQHNSAEGGNRAPAVNETHTGNNSPRAPASPIDWDAYYDSLPPRAPTPPYADDIPVATGTPPGSRAPTPPPGDHNDPLPFANGIPPTRPPAETTRNGRQAQEKYQGLCPCSRFEHPWNRKPQPMASQT
ncbi:hypothetical protein FB451DRAFT_1187503 [Mycena latifolia]|nr:hypothetical protein FB451DRAFT_1187503 [Mycena latifolia]